MNDKVFAILTVAVIGVIFSLFMAYRSSLPKNMSKLIFRDEDMGVKIGQESQKPFYMNVFIDKIFMDWVTVMEEPYDVIRRLLSYDSRTDKDKRIIIMEGRIVVTDKNDDQVDAVVWTIATLSKDIVVLMKLFIYSHPAAFSKGDYYIKAYRSCGYVHIEISAGGDVIIFSDEESYLYHTDSFDDDQDQGLGGALIKYYSHFIEYGDTVTCFNQTRYGSSLASITTNIQWITTSITKTTTASSEPLSHRLQRNSTHS